MKQIKLIVILLILSMSASAQRYYKLTQQYDSVAMRKLILTNTLQGAVTDSILTKKANGGVYKIHPSILSPTASNGITKVGNDFRLGGNTATGQTLINLGAASILNIRSVGGEVAVGNGVASIWARDAAFGDMGLIMNSSAGNVRMFLLDMVGNKGVVYADGFYRTNGRKDDLWIPDWFSVKSRIDSAINVKILSGSQTIDFASIAAGGFENQVLTIDGAEDGDVVSIGVPAGLLSTPGINFIGYIAAPNTAVIRCYNTTSSAYNPSSGLFKIKVFK